MKSASLLLLVVVIFFMNWSCSQDNLQGTLKEVKRELTTGEITTWNGKPYISFLVFKFENGICTDYSYKPDVSEIPYSLQGKILSVGRNVQFKIEKITEDELILLHYDPAIPDNPKTLRHIFVKINQI